jgi:hypothetical protein
MFSNEQIESTKRLFKLPMVVFKHGQLEGKQLSTISIGNKIIFQRNKFDLSALIKSN